MLDKEEFDTIFKEHYSALRLYACRFVLDPDVSADIVQDVFYNIWKIKNDFVPKGSMKSYLFSAVYYKCLNYIKHRKVQEKHTNNLLDIQREFESIYMEQITAYEESLLSSELISDVKKAISELPEQCHRIFLLSRKFGLKNREIAEFLQISIKVVERQISKALKRIQDHVISKM
jgi:RNA polymerase sigma-70 factor (family 1)